MAVTKEGACRTSDRQTSSHATRRGLARTITVAAALVVMGSTAAVAQSGSPVVRRTYAESREGVRPVLPVARGAPNILWIMLDDVGFGASSAFGGLVNTPTLDDLANHGLRFTNFHTAGVCSPSRAALLTGRNHHKVGMGLIPQRIMRAEFPGYTGLLQQKDGTIADYLRARGYSTYALGKWHLTPEEEQSDLGPFDHWPSGKGFDHFLGFLGGAEDQYLTDLVEDNRHIRPDGRHLNAQLADKAISYIDGQAKLAPDRPFFIYLAPGATHSPHQVDQSWIDRYRGLFDEGWDAYREKVFNRQKQMGVIAAEAQLPPRNPRVPAWSSLSDDQRRVNARFMESYAGFFEYTDYEIGRIVAHLKETGQLDDTVIFVVIGDNGADIGGVKNGGIRREFPSPISGDDRSQMSELLRNYDKIGTRETYSSYPMGWAQAANTPYRDWKTLANSEGGTRNPLIVSWPDGLTRKGEIRTQYTYLTDLLPTTLEIAGAKVPRSLNGARQTPIQGTSLTYSFANAASRSRHSVQYYFLYGSGAIYKDGWKASFSYRPDFVDLFGSFPAPERPENSAGEEVWELYDVDHDPTELHDLALIKPAKLEELKALFETEARSNHVFPLFNWTDIYMRSRAAASAPTRSTPPVRP